MQHQIQRVVHPALDGIRAVTSDGDLMSGMTQKISETIAQHYFIFNDENFHILYIIFFIQICKIECPKMTPTD